MSEANIRCNAIAERRSRRNAPRFAALVKRIEVHERRLDMREWSGAIFRHN